MDEKWKSIDDLAENDPNFLQSYRRVSLLFAWKSRSHPSKTTLCQNHQICMQSSAASHLEKPTILSKKSKVTVQSRNIDIPIFTRVWTKIYYEQVQILNIPPLKTKPIVRQSISIGVCPKQDKIFLKSGICFQTGQGNYFTFFKLCAGIRCLLSMHGTISPDHSRLTLVSPLLGRSNSPTSFEI